MTAKPALHVKGKQRFDEQARAFALAQQITHRCAWCKWHAKGTLEETARKYAEHRAKAHPDKRPKQRIKLKPGAWQTGQKRIDDNVAAARKVGAGRNAQ